MENVLNVIERLLGETCYVIDFLPEAVPEDGGRFFEVEDYLLDNACGSIKERFVRVILKLMCYYPIALLKDGRLDRPSPELVAKATFEVVENRTETLHFWFPKEDMLLVFDGDSLNLAIYNAPERTHEVFRQIALSEGLFWREAG